MFKHLIKVSFLTERRVMWKFVTNISVGVIFYFLSVLWSFFIPEYES